MNEDFDHIATNYDQSFTDTPIGICQRNLVFQAMENLLPNLNSMSVLELNGGTGRDALFFANNAKSILSTDISRNMVNEIQKRIKPHSNASSMRLDITEIGSIQFDHKFDLVFSNFGGFNCLTQTQIEAFFKASKELVTPESLINLVIMPRFCVWESLYFLSKLKFRDAFRRRSRKGALANVEGKMVKTYYYSTADIKKYAEGYEVVSSVPIGLSVPPSYLNSYFKNKPKKLNKYYEKDRKRLKRSRYSNWADHYLISLRLK